MKKIVYIAGKITGDPDYKAKFAAAQRYLEADGYIVLNPATLPQGLSNTAYTRICFAMIDVADVVAFMHGWRDSYGARLESQYSDYIGKKLYDLPPCVTSPDPHKTPDPPTDALISRRALYEAILSGRYPQTMGGAISALYDAPELCFWVKRRNKKEAADD